MWRTRSKNNRETRHTSIPADDGSGVAAASEFFLDSVSDDEMRSSGVPPTPVTGERYIVPSDGSGGWSALRGKLVSWNGSAWVAQVGGVDYQIGAVAHVLYENWLASFEQVGPTQSNGLDTDGNSYQFWVPDWVRDAFHSMIVEKVEDKDLTTPPASPANFARYIVGAGATGDWSGKDGMIALGVVRESTGQFEWIFRTPTEGLLTWIKDENKFYHYTAGGAWEPIGSNLALNDLSDVDAPSPSLGDVVYFDGTNWVNQPASTPGAHDLDSHSDVTITAPADRQVVLYDGGTSEFINDSLNLADLGDVDLTGLANGYTLVWDSVAGAWEAQAGPAAAPHQLLSASHSNTVVTGTQTTGDVAYYNGTNWTNRPNSLANLLTVSISGPASGQVLAYNGSNWVNQSISSSINLDDLANVNTTGKLNHDIIWWDSGTGKWVDRTLVLGDISNVSTAGAVNGQSLVFNGSTWGPGNPTATVTAEWGYFYGGGGGFITGGASGVTLSTVYTPNRFIVGSTGKWFMQVHCSANSPDITIYTSAGGITTSTTFGNTCIASLSAGQYFTISGPGLGTQYSVSIFKIGS